MKIKEYLKLSRSFNAGITACAPVLGALSMWNVNETSFFWLSILFLIGYFGHTYGFALNDILDVKIDQTSTELKDRPLVCKTLTMRNAWIFTLSSAVIAFLLAIIYAVHTSHYFPILILFISCLLTTIYDVISKKYPLMDIFVAGGIFFLILYGATSVSTNITSLAWIVCILGTLQVFFMQFIAGGLKDIENDFKRGANTLAVKMGVRIKKGILNTPLSFKILSYSIQITELILLFTPFFLINSKSFTPLHFYHYIQIALNHKEETRPLFYYPYQ